MQKMLSIVVTAASVCCLYAGQIEVPTEGLLFDLDASDTANFRFSENGFITNWIDSAKGEVFYNAGSETDGHLPYYDATAFGGRGAVSFGIPKGGEPKERVGSYLKHDGATRNQTVFMVYHWTNAVSNIPQMGGLFGQDNTDFGIRGDYFNRTYYSYDGHAMRGYVWIDGVCKRNRTGTSSDVVPSSTNVSKDPMVYCCVLTNDVDATATSGSCHGTYAVTIGHYDHQYNHSTYKNRFFAGKMAEVIAYDRALSDDEVDYVNDVLMHKWYGTETTHPFVTVTGDPVEAGTPVPAYGKYMKGEIGNDFSIADCLSTDTDGKRIVTAEKTAGQRSIYIGYEVVDASGTVLQSSATDESFSFAASEPVSVRWIFQRECRAAVTAGANGQVAIAGGAAGTEVEAWAYAGAKVRLQAIPSEGYHLAYWKGDVGTMDILDPDQKIVLGGETQLEAVFVPGAADYPKMLTRGLVFRVDASDSDSVRADANGFVTNWYSRVGDLSFDINVTGVKPYVQADAMGGRGSVRFGLKKDGATLANTPLKASSLGRAPVRTFLLALSQVKDAADMTYPIGYAGDSFSDETYNYGLSCYLGGRIYNASFIVNGRVWMDDGSLRQYPGKLSSSDKEYVAHFGDTKNTTHVLVCEDRDEKAADGSHPLSLGNANGDPTHTIGANRCFPGDIGEAAGYDRTLLPAEVRYVMAFMNKKWTGASFNLPRWTASTSVSADATYENLFLDGVETVTVAAGKTLVVNNLLVVSSDVTFNLGKGATLQIPEIVKYNPEAVVSFVLDDASLVCVEGGNAYRYDYECSSDVDNRCESPLDKADDTKAYQPLAWPGPVTGTGTIRLAGARPLKLAADDVIPDGLEWQLFGGTLDLNGRSLVAADVRGPARLINSADAAVTLTVGRDSAFVLESRLAGKISVVRQGSGDFMLGGLSTADGTLTLGSGSSALGFGLFAPGSISNLVCHLDASRLETLHFGEDGRVVQWDSLAGDDAVFVERSGTSARKPTTYFTYRGPDYADDALNGKPGLRFSLDADGKLTSATNSLFGDRAFVAKTVIAVVSPANTPGGEGYHWGHIWAQSNYGGGDYGGNCLKFENWVDGSENGWHWGQKADSNFDCVCVNGRMYFDRKVEISESRLAAASFGHPQVFAHSFASGLSTYTPAVGSLCDHVRNFRGVISEILVYSRCLTAEELQRVSTALMTKWGIEPYEDAVTVADGLLSASCEISFGGGATLDLGGITQEVASVSYDAACELSNGAFKPAKMIVIPNPSGVLPLLTANCGLDVTDCDLEFAVDPQNGKFIRAKGGLVGPFKSETGNTTPVVVTERKASVGKSGLCIYVR